MLKRIVLTLLILPLIITSCSKGEGSGNEFVLTGVRDVNLGVAGAGTLTISVEQTSGNNDPVTITVSDLPTGVTANVQPGTGTPTFSSTITFTKTGTLNAGSYPIKITAASSSFSRTYDLKLIVPAFNGFMVDNVLHSLTSMSHSNSAGTAGFTIVSNDGGLQSASGYFLGTWPTVDGTYTYDVGAASNTSMQLTYNPPSGPALTSHATGRKATVNISGGKLALSVTGVQIAFDTVVRSLTIGSHE